MKKLIYYGILLIAILLLSGCGTAGSYYNKGKKAFNKGDYEGAEANYSMAIAKNPNRAEYYIDYGMCFIALEQYDQAITQFDKAYLEKDIKLIQKNNKRILRGKGISYFYKQQYKEAIEEFELALQISELSELSMDILYYKGSAHRLTGSIEDAIEAYTMLLDIHPDNARALFERGFCYRIMGDYDNGLNDYDAAIALDTKNYLYYFGKYHLLKDNGKDNEAMIVLEDATTIEAKTDEQRYQQAKLQYYLGNYDIAWEALKEYEEKGFLEAKYYIGEIHRQNKNYKEAITYFESYLQEASIDTSVLNNQIGSCYLKLGEYQRALRFFEQGIEWNNPATLQVLRKNEIIAYESLGLFDKAEEKLRSYLSDYPEDARAKREILFLGTRLTKEAVIVP